MFESALIRRHAQGERLVDPGTIAETLFFYHHAHVLCDRELLLDLLRAVGPENLLRLLNAKQISLTYLRQGFGVLTNTEPTGIQFHNFHAYQIGGTIKKILSKSEEIAEITERALGKSRRAKNFAKMLMDQMIVRDLYSSSDAAGTLPDLAKQDLEDTRFVKTAVAHILNHLVPDFVVPKNFAFDIISMDDGRFMLGTNLDFPAINEKYHSNYPPEHSSVTPAYLISFLLDARVDAYFAADYMSEIVTTPMTSGLINLKMAELLLKRQKNLSQIDLFQEHCFEDARRIREVINAGERTFGEFLDLLDRANKFKAWLKGQNPDADLIKEYFKAATSSTWIEKLPAKSLRFSVATLLGLGADMLLGGGGLGTAAGVGFPAVDSLMLDRITKGWRPNHFIESDVKAFISEPR